MGQTGGREQPSKMGSDLYFSRSLIWHGDRVAEENWGLLGSCKILFYGEPRADGWKHGMGRSVVATQAH